MAPQQGAIKNRGYSRKQDSQEEPDETAIVSKPVENENKKAPPPPGKVVDIIRYNIIMSKYFCCIMLLSLIFSLKYVYLYMLYEDMCIHYLLCIKSAHLLFIALFSLISRY